MMDSWVQEKMVDLLDDDYLGAEHTLVKMHQPQKMLYISMTGEVE